MTKQYSFAYCACMFISLCSYVYYCVCYMFIAVFVCLVQLYWDVCCCVLYSYDQLSIAVLHQWWRVVIIFREVRYCRYQPMMEMKALMMSSCTLYPVLYIIFLCVYIEIKLFIIPVDSSTFTINSSTGYIILSSSLDRERDQSYSLRVTVSNSNLLL